MRRHASFGQNNCEMSQRKQKCNSKSKTRKNSAKQNKQKRISKSNCNALLNQKQVGSTRQQLHAQLQQQQQEEESFAKAWATLSNTLICALSQLLAALSYTLSLWALSQSISKRAQVRWGELHLPRSFTIITPRAKVICACKIHFYFNFIYFPCNVI